VKAWAAVLIVLALGVPVVSVEAEAQQPEKVYRIGYLTATFPELSTGWVTTLQRGLRDLGYVEGKNIVIEQRHAAGRPEKLPELATDLVRLKVDIFVVHGSVPAIQAVRNATTTTPVVMVAVPDPFAGGLVASLARPGGQVTGLSDFHGDLVPKRLDLLKEVAPSASRVAILFDSADPAASRQLEAVQTAAPTLGVTLLSVEVKGSGRDHIDRAIATLQRVRPDALLVIPFAGVTQSWLPEYAVKNRLPTIGTIRRWAESGFLMSYGANFQELYGRAATYVDKILKGAKPADLPVELPTKFELVINLKTAKALGLTIPRSLLLRADQVIE
jgi:putative tryptophan/tyrosine transport system substrate-binding protein